MNDINIALSVNPVLIITAWIVFFGCSVAAIALYYKRNKAGVPLLLVFLGAFMVLASTMASSHKVYDDLHIVTQTTQGEVEYAIVAKRDGWFGTKDSIIYSSDNYKNAYDVYEWYDVLASQNIEQ